MVYLESLFSNFCAFWGDFAVQNVPLHSAVVLSRVLSPRSCAEPMKEIRVLHKLCSGISYSTGRHEFNVNESAILIK